MTLDRLILDDVLADPMAYREKALAQSFSDVTIGSDTFKGIADCPGMEVARAAADAIPGTAPILTFLRKSPEGQIEPNFIHSDEMMGSHTGIYYMNPDPPDGDGTSFWEADGDGWRLTEHVPARFNRLLLFRAGLHHSRSLYANHGSGGNARLIQVIFLQ